MADAVAALAGFLKAELNKRTPVPQVNVTSPDVVVDTTALASAVVESGKANARALDGVVEAVASAIVQAAQSVPAADLAPVVAVLAEAVEAMGRTDTADRIGAVVEAVDRQTEAAAALVEATRANTAMLAEVAAAYREQTDLMKAGRSFEYDAEGRIVNVKVG